MALWPRFAARGSPGTRCEMQNVMMEMPNMTTSISTSLRAIYLSIFIARSLPFKGKGRYL